MFNKILVAAATTGALLCASSTSFAAVIVIDDFDSPQSLEILAAVPPTISGSSSVAASAIGGERDLLLEKLVGAEDDRIRARANPEGLKRLRHSQDSGVRGRTVVTWDGIDGSSDLSASGLGGIDFLIGASPVLQFGVDFADLAGPVIFEFFELGDATRIARAVINIASPSFPILTDTVFQRALADFDFLGGATLNSVFSNVGAIRMTLDGSAVAQTGWDIDLDFVRVNVPEPGSVLLFGAGLLSLVSVVRRRRYA